jgi:hypothetical protein
VFGLSSFDYAQMHGDGHSAHLMFLFEMDLTGVMFFILDSTLIKYITMYRPPKVKGEVVPVLF